MLILIHKDELANYSQLQEAFLKTDPQFITRIHPEIIKWKEKDIARLRNPIKNLRHQLYLVKQKFKR